MLRRISAHERARDSLPVVVLLAAAAGAIAVSGAGWTPGRAVEVGWMAAACAALPWRSRWPLAVAAMAVATSIAAMALDPGFVLAPAASLVALYTVATRTGRRVTIAAGLAAAAAIGTTRALVHPLPASLGATLVTLDLVLLAVGLGRVVRAQRAHRARLAQAEARADHAERLRAAEEAGRQTAEQRLGAVSDLYQAAVRPPAGTAPDGTGSDQPLPELTPREREVVTLVARGLTNEEIARHLFLATVTVKTHANRAMTKLRARDRAQLVVLAYQAGLVRPQRL